MGPRSRTLSIAELQVQTPLLVPSFTSKGLGYKDDGTSRADDLFQLVAPHLDRSVLISAFDFHHGLLPAAGRHVFEGEPSSLPASALLVVDSGGYETQQEWESGFVSSAESVSRPFVQADHLQIMNMIGARPNTLVVTYDGLDVMPAPYGEQIARARELSTKVAAVDVLLKPADSKWHVWGDLLPFVEDLSTFSVIGVTNEELGPTLAERLMSLTKLREFLDQNAVSAPIHVFGLLDPFLLPLYFWAGGEIFDGLSWQRYAYLEGVSMHIDDASALIGEIDMDPIHKRAYWQMLNLTTLTSLERKMRLFSGAPTDWSVFGDHAATLASISQRVSSKRGQGSNDG